MNKAICKVAGLKAIFARYIMMLIRDGDQPKYLQWVRKNINTAWGYRAPGRGLTFRDYRIPRPSGTIQSYEASSIAGFMQLCPPEE